MVAILLALTSRGVSAGPPDLTASLVSLVLAVVCTAGVGWWAHRLELARIQREQEELAAATPVGGVH